MPYHCKCLRLAQECKVGSCEYVVISELLVSFRCVQLGGTLGSWRLYGVLQQTISVYFHLVNMNLLYFAINCSKNTLPFLLSLPT